MHDAAATGTDMPSAFTVVRRMPPPHLSGLVRSMSGYSEQHSGNLGQREAASLVVPLIFSFGTPYRIALGRDPLERDTQSSFAAGLFPGPVHMWSDGAAACLQIDFTPLGAFCVFGGAVADLTCRMVEIDAVLGAEAVRLRQRLGDTNDWERRFDLAEAFVARRAVHRPAPAIAFVYRRLRESAGTARIAALAQDIGWSRTHLAGRFKQEIGVAPKTIARIMRFRHACRLAANGSRWAGIAAESGFADQAHLIREFRDLAGTTPIGWARDMAALDPRLISRLADLGDG